jgi:hypothetical protein
MPCTSAPAATHATKTTTEMFHDPAAQKPNPSSMNPQINSTHHPDGAAGKGHDSVVAAAE